MCKVQQGLYVCIGTGKCNLKEFLREWLLVVITNVRTYDQGVTSKKVENYPLEEGIEKTQENLGTLTEVNPGYDSESMESSVMRGIWGGESSEEREEEAKCMVS